MSYFAQIDSNNTVTRVLVVEREFIDTGRLGDPSTWLETGFNIRKNYAGIGYTYNESIDAFVPPKPFDSWTLDDDTGLWDPPVPPPTGGPAVWNEETQSWDET
jgi:hypothetical protein